MNIDQMIAQKVDELLPLLEISERCPDQISQMHAVLENRQKKHLPLLFWRSQNASIPGTTFTFKEQFYDMKKMLYGQLEEVVLSVAECFGAPVCIRPNMGTVLLPAALGLSCTVFDDAYPWLTDHYTKKEIDVISLADLESHPIIRQTLDFISYSRAVLPDSIQLYMPDTQGPFDLAHMIYGDQLFLDMYNDPAFVHACMELCTELYIQGTKLLKEALAEPLDTCYHGHALIQDIHMNNGGVRISEDTATLLSPDLIDEFVIPYDKKALEEFSGGFIHYCSFNAYLLEAYLNLEGVRAVNFGNPEKHDRKLTMQKFRDTDCCYFGKWPKSPEETAANYIFEMKTVSDHLILHIDAAESPQYNPAHLYELLFSAEKQDSIVSSEGTMSSKPWPRNRNLDIWGSTKTLTAKISER